MLLYKITPQSLSNYKEKSVIFSKPNLVQLYDYNYEKVTKARRINYFKKPTLDVYPIDLNIGFKTHISRRSAMYSRNIELSLKYDMTPDAERDVERDGIENIEKTKVITRRGTLVHIMESYYNNRNPSELYVRVTRYKGNIYMVIEENDDSVGKLTAGYTHNGRLQKFLFTNSLNEPPKIDEPYNENIELVGVHRCNFGKYDIIYSGEVQGIDSNETITNFDNVDALNDCRFVFAKQIWSAMKYKDSKYLKFWLQSYLANVKVIYIGYKIRDGIIAKPIERKVVEDIPKNCFWEPSICTGFLHEFLQNVEKLMSSVNCLKTVYVFHYDQRNKSFSYEIFKGETNKTFISKEYMKYCKEKSNA